MTDTEHRLLTAAKAKNPNAFDTALLVATPAERTRVSDELDLHIAESGDLPTTYFEEFQWGLTQ